MRIQTHDIKKSKAKPFPTGFVLSEPQSLSEPGSMRIVRLSQVNHPDWVIQSSN